MVLAGNTAIVTGAGSGLGRALVVSLATEGCNVVGIDISSPGIEATTKVAKGLPGSVVGVTADISKVDQIDAAMKQTLDAFGRLDVLINCAGIDFTLPVSDMTIDQWDRVVAVNLRAPFYFSKSAMTIMREQGGGHIVNISSTAGKRAWANAAAYHATKWGLIGLTRALGVEGRPHNILATLIVPGGMRTSFFDRLEEKPDPNNLQDPHAVASMILHILSSPEGSVVQEAIITPLTETSWP
ncbi:MAG: SDR family oxidoreductase [Chloroflexi bacterium]|nr:SDR family oxidoreductase [Chloroflexota bacterium]